jgi:ZIP family zinc transporter
MNQLVTIAVVSWLAGVAAFIGGLLAKFEGSTETESKREVVHGVVAFGGGILIAAVAFALVPEGISVLSPTTLAVTFSSGGLVFCAIDAVISRRHGSKAQSMAMLLDFVPEAMALGAVFARSERTGMLLALFIGLQNLPEGFNAHRENVSAGATAKASLLMLLVVSFLGPISACSGHLFLRNHQTVTACVMSAAGGGILYLIFQDIAPQAKLRRHWTPPLGAVLGFVVGMIGEQMLG